MASQVQPGDRAAEEADNQGHEGGSALTTMRADIRPLHPEDPLRLGRFRLVGRLGEGGQARVYLGADPSGERVAIKALFPVTRAGRTGRRRLAAEAEAVGRVEPLFTAGLVEIQLGGGVPYLVTEFIDGPSLHQQISRHGPLGDRALERLAAGTLSALAAIHAAGLVHHDVKPGNVLLGPDGPRLVDFGASTPVGVRFPGARSRAGVLTTPAFMAPELLTPGQITPAADLFSWASMMAFAGTGRGPFYAPEQARMLHRIEHEPPDLAGLPEVLVPVLRACLAKHPAERLTTSAALDRVRHQLAPDAPPTESDPRARWTVRPSWDCVTAPFQLPAYSM